MNPDQWLTSRRPSRPELRDAFTKLQRAVSHFEDLDDKVAAVLGDPSWLSSEPRFEPNACELQLVVTRMDADLSELAVVAGDVLFNLNAALDYIAVAIYRWSGGSVGGERQVYFPVKSDKVSFDKAAHGPLKRCDRAWINSIAMSQPFSFERPNTAPLLAIHELGKIDRHRQLHIAAVAPISVEVVVFPTDFTPASPTPSLDPDRRIKLGSRLLRIPGTVTGDNPSFTFPSIRVGIEMHIEERGTLLPLLRTGIEAVAGVLTTSDAVMHLPDHARGK